MKEIKAVGTTYRKLNTPCGLPTASVGRFEFVSGDIERFWNKVNKTGNCWLWKASRHGNGYGKFSLQDRACMAHRISWFLNQGEIPNGLLVLHKCDVRHCVKPDHLFLGTQKENILDAHRKKRMKNLRGENHPFAKLKNKQAEEIRSLYRTGFRQKEIADRLNLGKHVITSVVNYKTYK